MVSVPSRSSEELVCPYPTPILPSYREKCIMSLDICCGSPDGTLFPVSTLLTGVPQEAKNTPYSWEYYQVPYYAVIRDLVPNCADKISYTHSGGP